MKSKEELIAAFGDELNGLLLAAWAEEKDHSDFARDGKWMVFQMRRGRHLLERIWTFMQEQPKPLPVVNGRKENEKNPAHI